MTFGEHPIVAPLLVALALCAEALTLAAEDRSATALLSFGAGLCMIAIAAHSTVERNLL